MWSTRMDLLNGKGLLIHTRVQIKLAIGQCNAMPNPRDANDGLIISCYSNCFAKRESTLPLVLI